MEIRSEVRIFERNAEMVFEKGEGSGDCLDVEANNPWLNSEEEKIGNEYWEDLRSRNGGLELYKGSGSEIVETEGKEYKSSHGIEEVYIAPALCFTYKSRTPENNSQQQTPNYDPDANSNQQIVEVKNYDVEKVLEEQETHDLYCPNCNSCITKRVILKKRRKTISEIESNLRPNKIPNLGPNNGIALNEPLLNRDDQEQHILFKCLSCFTFFIPQECGFNIFDICGGNKERNQNSQIENKISTEPKNEVENANNSKSKNDSNQIWLFDVFRGNRNIPAHKSGNNDEIEPIGTKTHTEIPINEGSSSGTKGTSPVIIPPRRDEIIIPILDERPKFRPRNCILCPNINNWDIIKPIVYGGLIECIASLSVISSAAATGASTLNVFLLGIANLIGGFVLLLHELMELKRAQDEAGDLNNDELGRYFALLGRKGHFGLHATIAIISYIIFGLLPPLIYGFTFRETDNSEYKIISVALTSISCVAILSIGKAHVRTHGTYFKTMFYYVAIAVQSSGLSYVAGIFVKKLVDKLGWFSEGYSGAF